MSRPKKKLGLDDPKRVEICRDKGELHYRNDTCNTKSLTCPSRILNNLDLEVEDFLTNIARKLEGAKTSCHKDSPTFFIPRDAYEEILSYSNIYKTVESLDCCRHLSPEEQLNLASRIYQDCRKLLASLIAIGMEESLHRLMDEGVTDKCLPLRLEKNTDKHPRSPLTILVCNLAGHHHTTFNSWRLDNDRESFFRWTYAVTSPYLKRTSGKHIHYVFTPNDVIPITERYPPPESERSLTQRQTQTSMSASGGDRSHGGFGEVEIVKLHNSNFCFEDYGVGILFCWLFWVLYSNEPTAAALA